MDRRSRCDDAHEYDWYIDIYYTAVSQFVRWQVHERPPHEHDVFLDYEPAIVGCIRIRFDRSCPSRLAYPAAFAPDTLVAVLYSLRFGRPCNFFRIRFN